MNLEAIRNNQTVQLVEKFGYDAVAEKMGKPVEAIKDYVINLFGENDFEYYAKTSLYIEDDSRTEDKKIVLFEMNAAQKKLLNGIELQKSQGKPIRIVHLKPRQYGASTFFEGYIFRDVTGRKNRHATTISYVLDSAEHLRGIANRFYDRFPRSKPKESSRSSKTWKFPELDSTWRIDSAENLQAGHSFTNQILHCSELSRWQRDVPTLMRGLTSSVQATPDTMIIIESTANGYGDYFHDTWERAKRGSGYLAIFVSWFEIDKYAMPFFADHTYDNRHTRDQFEKNLDSYEKSLKEKFELSLEQLHWRKWKIEEDLKGDEDAFREQYPATDQEAFLSSGRPYFHVTVVRENLIKSQKADFQTGNLEYRKNGSETSVTFEEDRFGLWKVFQLPEDGWEYRYVTGSDPAEGRSATDDNKDPDYSVCTVLDRLSGKEVASFRGRVNTDEFEEEIYKAILLYKSACDCVETNNTAGGAVIKGLKEREVVNLYVRESQGKIDDQETKEYGFRTDKSTREILLNELRFRIKTGKYSSDNETFWGECLTFVKDKEGKPAAQYGEHDDTVIAAGLVIEAQNQAQELQPIVRPEEKIEYAPDADIPRQKHETVDYATF